MSEGNLKKEVYMNEKQTWSDAIKRDEIGEQVYTSGNVLTNFCHEIASECGWWKNTTTQDVPRLLMLCVSELAEAMEGHRKGLPDTHLPERSMLEVELADTVIRIFDMAGGLRLDVAGAIRDKLLYNTSREDHKPEVRADGGKSY